MNNTPRLYGFEVRLGLYPCTEDPSSTFIVKEAIAAITGYEIKLTEVYANSEFVRAACFINGKMIPSNINGKLVTINDKPTIVEDSEYAAKSLIKMNYLDVNVIWAAIEEMFSKCFVVNEQFNK